MTRKHLPALVVVLALARAAFGTCPASAPVLVSPADFATNVPFGSVVLDWNPVTDATGYEVWWQIDGGPFQMDTTTLTQKTIVVDPGRFVEWKAVAKAPSCTPMAAAHFHFTTSCPSGVPFLRNPDPGDTFPVGATIEFNWTAVPGAASYDIRITPDHGVTYSMLATDLTTTSFLTDAMPEGDWEWDVEANFDGACADVYSAHSQFFVTNCQTAPVELVEPANGAQSVANPITFKWRATPGAQKYNLYVGADGGTPQLLGTTESTQLTRTLVSGQNIVWTVQAEFGETCPPMTAAPFNFTRAANSGCPTNPGKAALVSPANNATNLASPVTFSWNPVAGATGYRLLIGFTNEDVKVIGTTTQTQLSVKLPAGTGVWLVQTLFGDDCPTTLSDRRTFTVTQGSSCPTAAPQLIAPANNAANNERTVLFKWSDVPDAIGYALYVATGGTNDFVLYGETDDDTTQLERFVPTGEIRWYVAARYSRCPDIKSTVFVFGSAETCSLAKPALVAPADNAEVTSPVTLSWTAVANATEYRITINGQNGNDALVQRTNQTSLVLRLPAGTFLWRVEALRGECSSASDERTFKVKENANCANNPAPVLVAPLGTQQQPVQAQSPVNFQWNAAQGAIAYRLWLSRDGQPFEDIALTTETHKSIELDAAHYAWFVQALFEGCAGTRSNIAYFFIPDTQGCSSQAPQILSPTQGASVTSPVTFSWTEVQDAEKYRVLAIVDNEPVLIGATEETELTANLPKGQTTFTIEAVFRECRSTFATRTTFTVTESQNCQTTAPNLIAPANGATLTNPDVDFVWDPVSGALKYAVIAEYNEGSETVLGTTEDTHLLRTLPAGDFEWRVVAFFNGCPARTSPTFRFTLSRPNECPDRKPSLLFPRDGQDVPSPIEFAWLGVPGASDYRVWVARRNEEPSIVATTEETSARVELPPGQYRWFVEARFPNNCPPTFSARDEFTADEPIPCTTPRRPEAHVVGKVVSGTQYRLHWTPLPNVSRYEVQESTSEDFEDAQSFVTGGTSKRFVHEVHGAPVPYHYRVRGIADCNDAPGPYSQVVTTFVVDPQTNNASTELGETGVVTQTIVLEGGDAPRQFTATTDKPSFHVSPAQGTVPARPGSLTLTVTADPAALDLGTNTASVKVTYTDSAKGVASHGSTVSTIPMSVSLVTPVTETGKGAPPPDSLIFGAVGHASGVNNSFFESDIRLTNISAQTMRYDVNYTPSGVDGTQTGSSTSVEVSPGETMALDDVVSTMFGDGTTGSSLGMLEIRPITTSDSGGSGLLGTAQQLIHSVASSRTYNFTPNGTFGQFIPATKFADFVGRGTILSLQQVAQSAKQRANFGFLEASGQGADLIVHVYDVANTLLATIPVNLLAMQHKQLNGLLQQNGINDLADGRVEVEVINGDGKVTAYVSEVDNATNDPLLVSAIVKGATHADRYVMPGMAYINTGAAFWVSDLRIFNAGTTSTPATLTFYPQGNPAGAMVRNVTIDAGEIEVLNNVLVNLFGVTSDAGGSIVITTPSETTLTASARTYNQTSVGTYGQFIPGVTVAESIGVGDRPLQILQVEQSTRIRTNIGLNETSGKPVTVEVSLITPDSLATPVVTIGLQANEFRQIGLVDFHLDDAVYNGRVTVQVIDGEGKVTAYGSAIDQITQDPTYVTAQ